MEHARRREFLALAWSVGRARATGVLGVDPLRGPREIVVVRDGGAVTSEIDPLGRKVDAELSRLAGHANAVVAFREGPIDAAASKCWPLDRWVRRHLDREVDVSLAAEISRDWSGQRLSLVPERAPDASSLDEVDGILVERLSRSATLAELGAAVRAPRYRVIALLHFLRTVGAVEAHGSRARLRHERASSPPPAPAGRAPREAALELLGLPPGASVALVKAAFRALAKKLHPDLHPNAGEATRRELERKLAVVNAAYGELIAGSPI